MDDLEAEGQGGSGTPKVAVVIAVRNEEDSIGRVLGALGKQTRPPSLVVVVDDGSTDGTVDAIRRADVRYELDVVSLRPHRGSKVGRPELAAVFNAGLAKVRDSAAAPGYVMILGADHALPEDYIERIVNEMERDPGLAVAAGWIRDEPYWEHAPRGSSMVIRFEFWNREGRLQFPETYGWESWVYLKASQLGYRTRSFKTIPTRVLRRTSATKGVLYGKAMYALGYFWPYAIGRCLLTASRSPRSAVQMLVGYFRHGEVERLDVSEWVGENQRRVLVRRALLVVSRQGRK